MQKPIIDCRSLLERQNEEFVPAAFQAITGRAPDIFGLIHYTQRLQRGASRELVLAEMRNSPEGLVYAVQAPSSELDQLLARYRRVRGLPLMGLRWFFLPRFGAAIPSANGFNWEHWANDCLGQIAARAAAAQVALQNVQTPGAHPELGTKIDHLQHQVDTLQSSVAALQGQGVSAHTLQPLQDAVAAAQFSPPSPSQVSWEARQHLHQLTQAVRD